MAQIALMTRRIDASTYAIELGNERIGTALVERRGGYSFHYFDDPGTVTHARTLKGVRERALSWILDRVGLV